MIEQTYAQILAELLAKHGNPHQYTVDIHRRWRRIAKGAKHNAAWLIGTKYI